ncbi:electron transfer flavoprotein subunit beta/FixA family protein [Labilibaculum euxinus]|uniref:Electron transfer flavoprotein subunit beta n=1 Tax=Labilibaculum euxinus TaxID=2686357 RepID=A0A7M4DA53_9BACT|nr:electron transfer flavoprotein subunit beta/FixA family protein [Labilibaculum euxinus]MUP39532.1 electron transfer flavoprotein beta subunit/FixA family protein [Labilibaculum euxinus]MVB08737.1 electron transfer flavoprotein beta subunit/FixA family protein [Labilibaculum euxinus]
MKILVCISNVPDTTTKVKFKEDNTLFDDSGVQWIINPWDELALTRALELKEDAGNSVDEVSVINVGGAQTDATLRKALAIGADKSFRIDACAADAYYVAGQIAAYLKENPFDIVFSGIESSDYNGSSVGAMIAEFMDYSGVSSVTSVNIDGDDVILYRAIPGGKQKIKAGVPLVAVVQKGIAKEPRIPAMRGIMMARKKPLEVMPAKEMEMLTKSVKFELPKAKGACKMIDAGHVEQLVELLKNEAKVL